MDAAISNSHKVHCTFTNELRKYILRRSAYKNTATDNGLHSSTSTIHNRYHPTQFHQYHPQQVLSYAIPTVPSTTGIIHPKQFHQYHPQQVLSYAVPPVPSTTGITPRSSTSTIHNRYYPMQFHQYRPKKVLSYAVPPVPSTTGIIHPTQFHQ